MHQFKKPMAVLLAAVCMLSAFAAMGCNNDKDSSVEESSEYVVPVPDSKVDTPGEETVSDIGKAVDYQGKVSVKLNTVRELDVQAGSSGRVLFCELTVTNTSDKVLDLSYLTHFTLNADGSALEVGRSALANSQATKYYHDKGMKLIHQPLIPKKDVTDSNPDSSNTVTGIVPILAPSKWDSLKLVYTPYKYYSNDTIEFEIRESDLVHITSTEVK